MQAFILPSQSRKRPLMATRTGAHYLLEGLVELGMEYLFANLGTDHAPIV